MRNDYVIRNYETGTDVYRHACQQLPPMVKGQLISFFNRPTDVEEFTDSMKKHYATMLLTGCVVSLGEHAEGVVDDVVYVDGFMETPVARSIAAIVSGAEAMYDTFAFARDCMAQCCPDLLVEIVRDEYERVWPGYVAGHPDFMDSLMNTDRFYRPLIVEALGCWAGHEARYDPDIRDTQQSRFVHAAVTGLLRYGKTGYFGIEEHVLMASVGIYTNPFPKVVDEKRVTTEMYSKLHSGNGTGTGCPSMPEAVDIMLAFHKQLPEGKR